MPQSINNIDRSSLTAVLNAAPMVPVITIERLEDALPLAIALRDGGLPVLEVTLRTEAGAAAISLIKREVEGVIVGAGTVINEQTLELACDAGSEFIVTPGSTDGLLQAATSCSVPLLPGIASVSDIMRCLDHGLHILKFFPAEAAGGVKALKAFAGPFSNLSFCPTGGIGLHNMLDYLSVPSVLSVGGSWVTPSQAVNEGDWSAITSLAQEASERVNALSEGNESIT